jgi:molecular chaperone GrpE (heat shock protein)
MVYAFDTLGYARRLRDTGISTEPAEAHAEAARDFVMAELVTKPDLLGIRQDIEAIRRELDTSIQAVRSDLLVTKQQLESALDNLGLRLTIRLGGMVAIAVAILATVIKL